MTKNEKDITLFPICTECAGGLNIYSGDYVEGFFISPKDDGRILLTYANNSSEESYSNTHICDSMALSILEEDKDLYKLVGHYQSNTKQIEYIFYTTQDVKKQLEEFISNCLSHKISGVGKEAEIVINSSGGKQSKAIGRFDLIPPRIFRVYITAKKEVEEKYINLMILMSNRVDGYIDTFMLIESIIKLEPKFLEIVAKVLEEGAAKYSRNNWRLISPEDHFNHALIHLYALIEGDTQDDHYAHFLTRIAMFAEQDENNYDFKLIE